VFYSAVQGVPSLFYIPSQWDSRTSGMRLPRFSALARARSTQVNLQSVDLSQRMLCIYQRKHHENPRLPMSPEACRSPSAFTMDWTMSTRFQQNQIRPRGGCVISALVLSDASFFLHRDFEVDCLMSQVAVNCGGVQELQTGSLGNVSCGQFARYERPALNRPAKVNP